MGPKCVPPPRTYRAKNRLYNGDIAAEEGRFTIEDVIRGVNDKMIRRHPHVFGDVKVDSVEDQLKLWEEIKKQEKNK